MTDLELIVEGVPQKLAPPARREDNEAWVPLDLFAPLVSCVVKPIDAGRQGICREGDAEICVPLLDGDTRSIDGILFGRLRAFAAALELQWHLCDDDALQVGHVAAASGLSIGDRPPEIRLPEDGSTDIVSSEDVIGKPAVFYMWASW
jgi:hypothetical protein